MFGTGSPRWLAIAVITTCLVLASGTVWGQETAVSPFSVNYFSNNLASNHPAGFDQKVRVVNPGLYDTGYPPNNLCAMIYVFDNQQEMTNCCACLISANGLLELSLSNNLTVNSYTGTTPNDGDIKIVSALENDYFHVQPPSGPPIQSATDCDPSGGGRKGSGYALNVVPEKELVAWGTHLPGYHKSDGSTTEDAFLLSDLSVSELDGLQEQCTNIVENGSGSGMCTGPAPNSSTVCDFQTAP